MGKMKLFSDGSSIFECGDNEFDVEEGINSNCY